MPPTSAGGITYPTNKLLIGNKVKADNIKSPQRSSISPAPTITKSTASNIEPPLAQGHDPFKKISTSSEEVAGSYNRQKQLPITTPSDSGAVSLAYLMSLNIGFTPEQIRLLTDHSRGAPAIKTAPETPASPEQRPLSLSSPGRHLDAIPIPPAPTTSPKAPLVSYASSSSDSAPNSPVLSKHVPAATINVTPFVPPISTEGREKGPETKARAPGIATVGKSLPLSTIGPPGLSDRSMPKSGSKSIETLVSGNGPTSSKETHIGPIKFTLPRPSTSSAAISQHNPLLPGAPSASATSRSEALRQQREMIIGSEVYRNRYSHVAGSLVDKFRALSLKDPVPTSNSTTTATVVSLRSRSPMPVVQNPPIAKLPSKARLLNPSFIPEPPATAGSSSSMLAPKSVNKSPQETLGSLAPRSTRSSGLSLPPHLRGKTANTDIGVAVRAQYGR